MAAMLKYVCPKCGVILKVPKLSTGKNIKCQKCGVEFLAVPAKTRKKKTAILLIIVFLVLAGVFYKYYVDFAVSLKSQNFENFAKSLFEKNCKDLPIVFKRFCGFRKESKDKYLAIIEVEYEKKMLVDKSGKIGIEVVPQDLYFFIELEDFGDSYYYKFSSETVTVLEAIMRETEFGSFNNNDGGNE